VIERFVDIHLDVRREVMLPAGRPIGDMLTDWGLTDALQEQLWVVAYDGQKRVMTVMQTAMGGYNEMIVSVTPTIAAVLMAGAQRFILAHNHPSGNVQPTNEDLDLTEIMRKASNTVGVYLEDHVIVGPPDRFLSLRAARLYAPPIIPESAAVRARGGR
jgi:DNA repair protein RadC